MESIANPPIPIDQQCLVALFDLHPLRFETVFRNEPPGELKSVNYAVLRNGKADLHLGADKDMENASGQGGCSFDIVDYDESLERVRAAGARFYLEPGTIPTGQRTFGIRDPDGNLISFVDVG